MDMRTGHIITGKELKGLSEEARKYFAPIEVDEAIVIQNQRLEERPEYYEKRKKLKKLKELVKDIDVDLELRLIKEKKSNLSATQRALIIEYAGEQR